MGDATGGTNNVVTGSGQSWFARKRRLLVVVGVTVAVIAIAGGVWFVLAKTSLFTKPTPQQRVDLNSLSPTEAVKAAQMEIDNARTDSEKAAAYTDLGQSYMRSGQTKQAITAYQQAVSSSQTAAGSSGSGSSSSGGSSGSGGSQAAELAALAQLATAYNVDNDPAQTIATFQKIIAVLEQSNDPVLKEQIPKYQNAINNLKTEGHI